MSSGKARFSGAKTVTVANRDSRVKEILKRFIPALFDERGNEHEDYALAINMVMPDAISPADKSVYGMSTEGNGILAEIQTAVWIAARTIADLRLMNSSSDTKRELELLSRGTWIPGLEEPLSQTNIAKVSDESWWAIVDATFPKIPKIPDDFTTGAKRSVANPLADKPRQAELIHCAAMEMTTRIVRSLAGNESALGISLTTYSYRQKKPTKIVELLKELGEAAGIFLGHGAWRNRLAEAKKIV